MRYRKFTVNDSVQQPAFKITTILFQHPLNLSCVQLHLGNELSQINHELIFMKKEINRFHECNRISGIEFSQIILIVLIQPAKIVLQLMPPLIHITIRSLL